MTTATKTNEQIIADALANWDGEQTMEQAVAEWANCHHAEVHETGEVYIEQPMAGHYLTDERQGELVAWLRSRKMI